MKTLVWGLFICVVIYSVMDGLRTYHLLKLGYDEVNPIVQLTITHFGTVPGIMLIKAWSFVIGIVTVAFVTENAS